MQQLTLTQPTKPQPLPLGTIKAQKLGLDALAILKFWQPDGLMAWYAAESDGNGTYFGVVSNNGKTELRRFTRDEIKDTCGLFGLFAELDHWYTPQSLRVLLAGTAW